MLIFQRELKFNTNVNNFDIDLLDFDLVFADSLATPTNAVTLFDDLIITPDDVSTNLNDGFERTPLDPVFSTVAARLQDGLNENIQYILRENETGGLSEERGGSENNFFLFGNPTSAPLLAEATLESFFLRVIDFPTFVAGATNPPGAAAEPLEIVLELSIYGSIVPVPEPSTGWLFVAGLVTLGAALFSRQRRPTQVKVAGPPQQR